MANEASISELSGMNAIRYETDPAINISKGTLMVLSGDIAVAKSASVNQPYAGVAAADHKASEGDTQIALHVPGQCNIFEMKAGSPIGLGAELAISAANFVMARMKDISGGTLVGQALEAGTLNEIIRVKS